jgi:hypothetical protein
MIQNCSRKFQSLGVLRQNSLSDASYIFEIRRREFASEINYVRGFSSIFESNKIK